MRRASADRTVKLLMVSHSSGGFGAEGAMLELVDALDPHGISVHVLVPRAGPLTTALEERGVPFEVAPYRWWVDRKVGLARRLAKTLWNLAAVLPVAGAVRRAKADIVYTNTIAVCDGALAARLLGLPHVWHIHEFGLEDHGLSFDVGERIAYRLMDRLSGRLIANSNAVAKKYSRHVQADKLSVVWQSVTPRRGGVPDLPKRDPGVFRCAIVGFLQEEKGQHEAIEAVAILRDRGFPMELWVIGSGNAAYEKRLRDLVSDRGTEGQVRFTGFVEAPFEYMREMDAVLVCSRSEAFGRVTVEAMLAGTAVVGADGGCTPELVQDGVTGLLYAVGSAESLADRIQALAAGPGTAERMGARALEWASGGFTKERYGAEIAAIVRGLC